MPLLTDVYYPYIYDGYLSKKEVDKLSNDEKQKYVRYTLVKLDTKFNSNESLKLNGKEYKLKVIDSQFKRNEEFIDKGNYNYFYSSNFKTNQTYKKYEDKLAVKDVLLDFSGIYGGYVELMQDFLNIYYENIDSKFDEVFGHALKVEDKKIIWDKKNVNLEHKIKSKGNVKKKYILQNRNTTSAPENIYVILKLIDPENTIILGTNSAGALLGVDSQMTFMPNSKISLSYENLLLQKYKGLDEGKGIMPDIWLDTSDPKVLDKIDKFIKNKRLN